MIAGALEIQLLADVARIRKDMADAKGIVTSTMGGIEKAAGAATKVLGLLGVGLSAGMFTNWIKGTINAQDELAKMSQKVGVSVEQLAGLQHAAGMSGTSLDGVQKGLKAVSTQLFDAGKGLKSSQENFSALGISIYDATGNLKSADAVMIEVADQFRAMEDGTNKTALATKLFGRAGLDLIPMLNEGSAGLAALIAEGQKYNPVTEESAKQAELFNDNLDRLKGVASSFGVTLANGLLPHLSELSESFVEFTRSGGMNKLIDGLKALGEIVVIGGALYLGITSLAAGAVALYAAGSSGAIGIGLLNTSLFGTAMAATTAAGGLYTVSTAAAVLVAAFAGWKIGEYLYENFLQAKIAGMAFVDTMLTGFEYLKFGGAVMWETYAASFNTATDWIKTGYAELLDVIASGMDIIGADDVAAGYRRFADEVRKGAGASQTLAQKIAALRSEMDGNIASNKAIFSAMVDYETQAAAAGKATSAFSVETSEASTATQALGVRIAGTDEEIKAFEDSIKEFLKEQKKNKDAIRDTIAALEHEQVSLGMTTRAQAVFNAVTEASARQALPAEIAKIAELTARNYDLAESSKVAASAETKAAAERTKAVEQEAEKARDNWQRTHEYLSSAFVDIMDNGGNAFDNIAKSFETMVKRMVAEWAASGLMKMFGMGGGPAGTATSAISSLFGGGGGSGSGIGAGEAMSLAKLIPAAGQFAAGLTGTATGIAAGTMGPPTAAASLGASITSAIAAIPGWGWALMGTAALAAVLNNDDGKTRENAGMLVAPTPGAKSQYLFDVDRFNSGLQVQGVSRRADQSDAAEVINAFREVDTVLGALVKELGGTMDLTNATLAGLDEQARAGSSGTFFGKGGNGSLSGDMTAQVNYFVDQLADHVSGLDSALLDSIRSAGTAEQAIDLLRKAVEDKSIADKAAEVTTKNAEKAAEKLAAAEERLLGKRLDIIKDLSGELDSAISVYRSVQASIYAAQGAIPMFGADETIAGQIAQVTEHRDLILKTHAEQMKAEEELHKQRISFAESFTDYTRNLRLGDMGGLSSAAQLALAQNNFRTLAGAAQGGDMKALKKLQDAAEQYVSEADQSFASSGGRKTVVAEVLGVMDGLAEQLAASEFDPTAANQALVDKLEELNERLYGIGVGINQSIIDELKSMNVTLSDLSPNIQDSLLEAIGHWVQTTSPGGQTMLDALGGIKGAVDLLPPSIGTYMSTSMGTLMQSMLSSGLRPGGIAAQIPAGSIVESAANQYLGQQGLGTVDMYRIRQDAILRDFTAAKEAATSEEQLVRDIHAAAIANGITSAQAATAVGFSQSEILAKAAQYGLPAFATGGDHLGGYRVVGERGPELEATGRSRIFSAQQTKDIFSGAGANGGEALAELRALRQENAAQRAELAEIKQVLFTAADFSGRQRERIAKGIERVADAEAGTAGVGSERYAKRR